MAKNTDNIGARYFNRATLRILSRKGITVVGATWAPDQNGNYANGETVFQLDDNGTGRVRTFLHILAIAEGTLAIAHERAHAGNVWRPTSSR